MTLKPNTLLFIFFGFISFGFKSSAQTAHNDKTIEVALRMIGHEVLLMSNDRVSRILPIKKENNQYKIAFETDFEFIPNQLVTRVDRVFKQSGINKNYILQVARCDTNEVVYSFKINNSEKSDIIPCKERVQPKFCYHLLVSFIEEKASNLSESSISTGSSSSFFNKAKSLNYTIIGVFLVVIILIAFRFWNKKYKPTQNPDLISIGGFKLNKLNAELLFEKQKIILTSKEADLLILLYEALNTTVEREVILNEVWGNEGDYIGRTVDVFISKLRKKLQLDSKVKIMNIRGIGYKLVITS